MKLLEQNLRWPLAIYTIKWDLTANQMTQLAVGSSEEFHINWHSRCFCLLATFFVTVPSLQIIMGTMLPCKVLIFLDIFKLCSENYTLNDLSILVRNNHVEQIFMYFLSWSSNDKSSHYSCYFQHILIFPILVYTNDLHKSRMQSFMNIYVRDTTVFWCTGKILDDRKLAVDLSNDRVLTAR